MDDLADTAQATLNRGLRQTVSMAAAGVSRETPVLRWVTDRGLRLPTGTATLEAYAALQAEHLPEVEELVPADDSLLVVLREGACPPAGLQHVLNAMRHGAPPPPPREREHAIPLCFDGEDLEFVAQSAGLDRAGLIALLLGLRLKVRFLGFQPGFAYLEGLPPALHVPRLAVPRKRVAAGSFALAGGYCGIYPASGPGGWRVLATTGLAMFDPLATPPALLQAGDVVRLVAA